ncbi:pyrroline-5-carboxylate reductase [bacterium]|nr:pyrroline-5-carboxylate reductase [bacterium]
MASFARQSSNSSISKDRFVATTIGFLGCGKMAQALARGFVRSGVVKPADIIGSDLFEPARKALRDEIGAAVTTSNLEVCQKASVLILAVKPQSIGTLLQEIASAVNDKHLIVSIVTGISTSKLSELLGAERRIVRVMPNTPCLVGEAASGIAAGAKATKQDAELVEKLFQSVGVAHRVSEPLLDAVTGLSGSGPAYIYQVIEAMSDGGVKAGLARDVATALAAQTVLGAAKMVLETGIHPGALKDMVTSPAGTTIAGLAILEQRAVRSAFIDAVDAASRRARELGG